MNTDTLTTEVLQSLLAASDERKLCALRTLRGEPLPDEHEAQHTDPSAAGPILLTMSATAAMLGVSRSTLWRMIRHGVLTPIEILPGTHRISRAQVEAFAKPTSRPKRKTTTTKKET